MDAGGRPVMKGLLFLAIGWVCAGYAAFGSDDATLRLAKELHSEGRHEAAALEFRRLALTESNRDTRSGYLWAAAYHYHLCGQRDSVGSLLDAAEDASPRAEGACALLRGEMALSNARPAEARFHIQSLARSTSGDPALYAAIRTSQAYLMEKNACEASRMLLNIENMPDRHRRITAIERYQTGHDRMPWLGGLLGVIPGLGYLYSGEYANAVRSMLLNGIFIWGMVDTAQDREWGAFAALTFVESIWYTGSIYGGIDAAHRFNRDRLSACEADLVGSARMTFSPETLPVFTLRFEF